jgi:hypothetical protein
MAADRKRLTPVTFCTTGCSRIAAREPANRKGLSRSSGVFGARWRSVSGSSNAMAISVARFSRLSRMPKVQSGISQPRSTIGLDHRSTQGSRE